MARPTRDDQPAPSRPRRRPSGEVPGTPDAAAAALRAENSRLAAAVDGLPHGLLLLDRRFRVDFCNRAFLGLLGLAPEAAGGLGGASVARLLRRAEAAGGLPPGGARRCLGRCRAALRDVAAGDASPPAARLELPGGRAAALAARPSPDGGGWTVALEDVTARRDAEARAERSARVDPLTGLPNRLLFRERLAEAAAAAARAAQAGPEDGGEAAAAAVLCLDLDRFEAVNDTLGHAVGDALLQAVAGRLRSAVRDTDTVASLGGGGFAILQAAPPPGRPPRGAGAALAERLVDLVGRAYLVEGHLVNVGASVGVATLGAGCGGGATADPDRALNEADLALHRAKAEGRGTFRLFEPGMGARARARRTLELDLRRALALRELELHYQPQANLASGRIAGFEALLRWRHPGRGLVPPADFVPLAEEVGLIVPLGAWALRAACREAARWPGDLSVAVNLSPVQFAGPDLVGAVTSALAAAGLPARRLELEITESVLLEESEAVLATLHRLRGLGARIALDDFGTGYASLSYLRGFPFDKIKIDRSFVLGLCDDGDGGGGAPAGDPAAIVRAIAGLGASFGMAVTAEGVETEEQLRQVRREGCTEVQGYLIGRPVPAGEIDGLLAATAAGAAAVTGGVRPGRAA